MKELLCECLGSFLILINVQKFCVPFVVGFVGGLKRGVEGGWLAVSGAGRVEFASVWQAGREWHLAA